MKYSFKITDDGTEPEGDYDTISEAQEAAEREYGSEPGVKITIFELVPVRSAQTRRQLKWNTR